MSTSVLLHLVSEAELGTFEREVIPSVSALVDPFSLELLVVLLVVENGLNVPLSKFARFLLVLFIDTVFFEVFAFVGAAVLHFLEQSLAGAVVLTVLILVARLVVTRHDVLRYEGHVLLDALGVEAGRVVLCRDNILFLLVQLMRHDRHGHYEAFQVLRN